MVDVVFRDALRNPWRKRAIVRFRHVNYAA